MNEGKGSEARQGEARCSFGSSDPVGMQTSTSSSPSGADSHKYLLLPFLSSRLIFIPLRLLPRMSGLSGGSHAFRLVFRKMSYSRIKTWNICACVITVQRLERCELIARRRIFDVFPFAN